VVVEAPEHVIENIRLTQKAAAGKKVVKKQAPTKGYAHWDRATFDRLVNGAPEPLVSRFEVNFGMLLNLLQSDPFEMGDGYRRLVRLVLRSHGSDYVKKQHLKTAARWADWTRPRRPTRWTCSAWSKPSWRTRTRSSTRSSTSSRATRSTS
jgi:hypothetical protein